MTFAQPSTLSRPLVLPPLFRLVTLREVGDAHRHAIAQAEMLGAGAIVWVRRFDLAEFAVVLEPEEPLATARRALFAGMAALAKALATLAPPEMPFSFDWPDAIRVDGVLVGGCRLAWPEGAREDEVPDWLVFSVMIRMSVMRGGDPGLRPMQGGLDELGFDAPDAGALIEAFSRHLLANFHDWQEQGFDVVAARYLAQLGEDGARDGRLTAGGDLVTSGGGSAALAPALAEPRWLDPESGTPWL